MDFRRVEIELSFTLLSLAQIDANDSDLTDEKLFERHFPEEEDDAFQASMMALHGSTCSTDLDFSLTMEPPPPQVNSCGHRPLASLSLDWPRQMFSIWIEVHPFHTFITTTDVRPFFFFHLFE